MFQENPTMDRARFLAQIDSVFGVSPRNAGNKDTLWINREQIESRLSGYLSAISPHVCVDGPTGSGKSSLVKTVVTRLKKDYVEVQIANDTDWNSFCLECAKKICDKMSVKKGLSPKLSAEWDSVFPKINFELGVTDKRKALREEAQNWSIHFVARSISQLGLILILDDYEKISNEMNKKIADLCKIMTGTYVGKVILIGTGEIFFRLVQEDMALDGRIEEVSVAGISDRYEIWEFLEDGFGRLGFEVSTPSGERNERRERQKAYSISVFQAADGMPKYINQVGAKICQNAIGNWNKSSVRTKISGNDIVNTCKIIAKENVSRCYNNWELSP